MLPLLLAMDADTLLACGRASSRLLRLVRDREVWRHLLTQTDELTNEKLEQLVEFGSSKIPEMMAEVLKETARRMSRPGNEPQKKRAGYVKMMLSIQGWGSLDVYELDGDHLEKLAQVATTVESSFTILEVEQQGNRIPEGNTSIPLWKQIVAHVECQGETLDKLDLDCLYFHLLGIGGIDNIFLDLLKMSKWWRVKKLYMAHGASRGNSWATLASSASTGRIDFCHAYTPNGFEDAKREDVRKVWEITSEMRIFVESVFVFNGVPMGAEYDIRSVGKDQAGDPEANWQKLVEIAGLPES